MRYERQGREYARPEASDVLGGVCLLILFIALVAAAAILEPEPSGQPYQCAQTQNSRS